MKLESEKNLINKMLLAGMLGILLIVAGVIAVACAGKDKTSSKVPVALNSADEVVSEVSTGSNTAAYERIIALVKSIDNEQGQMQIVDVDSGLQITLSISSAVVFEDEYGSAIVKDQILPGYLVSIKYDKTTYVPESVKIAAQAQTIKNLSSFILNEELKTIQIGSDIYSFDENLVALDGEEALVLSEISVADDIVVRAYQGKIWSIIIENGHGFIVLTNYDAYLEGRLEVGNRTSYTIIKDMKVPVTVGVHQVIITKDDMTPYSASVFIEEDQDYIIDLSDLQPKIATVEFQIVQDGSVLYIEDESVEYLGQQILLNFGQYKLRVENEGFLPWEGILVVDQPYIKQSIDMQVEPLFLHMSAPIGSELYIDGVLQGTMVEGRTIDVPIIPGGHILVLRKEGYISWSQNVFIEDLGEDYYYTVSELVEIPANPEPETPPIDGETPPVDSETPPVDSETPPVNGEVPPVDGEVPPVNGEVPPVNGNNGG